MSKPDMFATAEREEWMSAQLEQELKALAVNGRVACAQAQQFAAKHGIPMVENKPLAQNLYKLDLGQEVPPKFYQAVAEILAYVYGLRKKKAGTR